MSLKWKIYYWDKSTFDNTMGTPLEAPCDGVICITQPREINGHDVLHMHNFYFYSHKEEEWWGCDFDGILGRLRMGHEVYALKHGFSVSDEEYLSIRDMAINDPDMAPKSAWKKGETPIKIGY